MGVGPCAGRTKRPALATDAGLRRRWKGGRSRPRRPDAVARAKTCSSGAELLRQLLRGELGRPRSPDGSWDARPGFASSGGASRRSAIDTKRRRSSSATRRNAGREWRPWSPRSRFGSPRLSAIPYARDHDLTHDACVRRGACGADLRTDSVRPTLRVDAVASRAGASVVRHADWRFDGRNRREVRELQQFADELRARAVTR